MKKPFFSPHKRKGAKMKNILASLRLGGAILLLSSLTTIHAQGLTIGSGTKVYLGDATLYLPNSWTDEGTFNADTGTVVFDGTGNQTVSDSSGEKFYSLTINKASDTLQLLNDITIYNAASMESGTLAFHNDTVTFGTSGYLNQTGGNLASGGVLAASATLNNPSSVNVAGLGAEITSSADLGATKVYRGTTPQTASGNTGVDRYYDIIPANDASLNAMLVFHYDTTELNGLTESTLQLYRSTDSGTTWTNMGGTLSTTAKTVTLNGIGSFSRWTLGGSGDHSLPVQATDFLATSDIGSVTLSWKTQSEVNNAGFNVLREERRITNNEQGTPSYELIASYTTDDSLRGLGTSSTGRSYDFTDTKVESGIRYMYKIQSVSTNGTTKDLSTIPVTVDVPKTYALYQNYPNPFNPTTIINYQLPTSSQVTLKIYDVLGREVATLVDGQQSAGIYKVNFDGSRFASGVYFYRISAAGNDGQKFVSIKKLVLMK